MLTAGPQKLLETHDNREMTEVKEVKEEEFDSPDNPFQRKKNLSITIDDKDNATKGDPSKLVPSGKADFVRAKPRNSELKKPLEGLDISREKSKKLQPKAPSKKPE